MLLSVSVVASAQSNTGEVAGVVRHSSGGVLAGATIVASHTATGLIVERVTDSAGRFFFPALRTGQWEIRVSLTGFTPHTLKGIVLEMGRTLDLEVTLSVEGVSETVTVTVGAPMLQTTTAEISDVIANQQVVQLPLNGRNVSRWRT